MSRSRRKICLSPGRWSAPRVCLCLEHIWARQHKLLATATLLSWQVIYFADSSSRIFTVQRTKLGQSPESQIRQTRLTQLYSLSLEKASTQLLGGGQLGETLSEQLAGMYAHRPDVCIASSLVQKALVDTFPKCHAGTPARSKNARVRDEESDRDIVRSTHKHNVGFPS